MRLQNTHLAKYVGWFTGLIQNIDVPTILCRLNKFFGLNKEKWMAELISYTVNLANPLDYASLVGIGQQDQQTTTRENECSDGH